MRRLLLLLVTALLTLTGGAFADEVPASRPIVLNAPAAGSDLPDMGSPAAAYISRTDEFRLGAMVTRELRDQGALLGRQMPAMDVLGGDQVERLAVEPGILPAGVVNEVSQMHEPEPGAAHPFADRRLHEAPR